MHVLLGCYKEYGRCKWHDSCVVCNRDMPLLVVLTMFDVSVDAMYDERVAILCVKVIACLSRHGYVIILQRVTISILEHGPSGAFVCVY